MLNNTDGLSPAEIVDEAKCNNPEDENASKIDAVKLKPKMTLLNGCTISIGTIIASGVFISPGKVVQKTGSYNAALLVWTLGGVYSMIGSYCYAELGTLVRKPGAEYAYIMECFGPLLAFIRLWSECMIGRPCTVAVTSLTFGEMVMWTVYPNCEPTKMSKTLFAICCVLILTFINYYDVKWATRAQDIFTFAKLIALFAIISFGLYFLGTGNVKYFTFENTKNFTSLGSSFYACLFAYKGWNYLNLIIEELIDPIKNLPRVLAISCTLITFVFLMTNVSFFTILSPAEIQGTSGAAIKFVGHVTQYLELFVPVFVALSCCGGINGELLTTSRLFYAGACEGQMPDILAMIQIKRCIPAPSVLAISILSIFYIVLTDVDGLIGYLSFSTWLCIGMGVLCLPWLRWTQPNKERPIRVNLIFPIIFIAATILLTILAIIDNPENTLYGTLMMLSSIPVYYIFIAWKNKPKGIQRAMNNMTKGLQKLMLVVPKTD